MRADDRRSFLMRHPLLAMGMALFAPLAIATTLVFINRLARPTAVSGTTPPSVLAIWGGLALVSLLGFCILAAMSWRRRLGRIPDYLCGQCGYDRRGVPDLSPCPECGAPTVGE